MKPLQYGTDWKFCPECQCIVKRDNVNSWETCNHDFRPNSPKAVLENQARELEALSMPAYQVRTYQSPFEFESFLDFARKASPRLIIEVGAFHGGVTWRMSEAFGFSADIIVVDRCFDYWLAGDIPNVTKFCGDSVAMAPLVGQYLNGNKVDLLFIDGDHSYAGEFADYRNYEPFVRPGGIIALHDTQSIPEVGRVFHEINGRHKLELYSYQGIGVVIK